MAARTDQIRTDRRVGTGLLNHASEGATVVEEGTQPEGSSRGIRNNDIGCVRVSGPFRRLMKRKDPGRLSANLEEKAFLQPHSDNLAGEDAPIQDARPCFSHSLS